MKIMVVDDSAAMRMMVKRMLKIAGFQGHDVVEAADGAEALDKIRNDKPDLVLSDWNMPNMTGMELLTALNAGNIRLNFGFVTTESTQAMRDAVEEAGAKFLIAKPFTEESVTEALQPFLP